MSLDTTPALVNNQPLAGRLTCTIAEAIAATGLGRTTIWRAQKNQKIKTKKVGRRRLILVSTLRQLVGADEQAAA